MKPCFQLDRVAGVYVTNPGGTLLATAGRDVHLVGAILSNAGAGGVTSVKATHDIRLDTVKTSSSQDTSWDANNYVRTSQSAEVGSQIVTNGATMLDADNDIHIRQGRLDAGAGLVLVHADHNVDISAGQSTQTLEEAHQKKDSGFLSSTTTTTRNTLEETLSHGSSVSGGIVSITSDNDITLEGAAIRGVDGVLVHAGKVLSIFEARDSRSESASVSTKKSGFAGSFAGVPVPMGAASRDATTSMSNTAVASTITSDKGGVLLQGDSVALLQGVKVNAAKDVTIKGGVVSITAATNYSSSSSEHYTRGTNIGVTGWHDPGKGIDAKNTDKSDQQASSLDRSAFKGANVEIEATGEDGKGGVLTMAGTTVDTPGELTLRANNLILQTQTTQTDLSRTSEGGDWAWQKVKGEGTSDQTTHYNQFNVGKLVTPAHSVQVGLGAKDSVAALAQQPGMGWIEQINNDPELAGKVDWVKVEEAHKSWDYEQQGLTPAAAAVATLVVAYFTAGSASGVGAAAGNASAVAAGEGVAMAGGGAFLSATGATISSVVGGAVTAGLSALAGQTAVALINNRGNLADTLHDLGSSSNVRNLLTAIVTGGVLGGMNLNPTGLPTSGAGSQGFMVQLGQNLQAGVARALIATAIINGGSLEDSLRDSIKTAFLDTLAAQAANNIGDWTQAGALDDFTNKVAHAIAGCMVGAARTDTSGGCSAGAIGAAIGEMAAEAYGRKADTTQFAAMIAGVAAALTGATAAEVNLASQAGANAAANNYLSHSPFANVRNLVNKESARLTAECGANCTAEDFKRIDAQMQRLETAAQYLETQKRSQLATEQAVMLGENIAALLPVYGTPIALYQALTGESLSGKDLSTAERFFNGVAAALPLGNAAFRIIASSVADVRIASSVGANGGVAAGELTGTRTAINLADDAATMRSLIRENESATTLANNGYRVQQNPPTLPNGKNSDYIVNGEVFDNYAPSTGNVRNAASEIDKKVARGQADNVVVNLADTSIAPAAMRDQLTNYPIPGLRQVIIIDKSGALVVVNFSGK